MTEGWNGLGGWLGLGGLGPQRGGRGGGGESRMSGSGGL